MKDSVSRTCPHCNKNFYTKDIRKIYCDSRCRFAYWDARHPRIGTKNMIPKE